MTNNDTGSGLWDFTFHCPFCNEEDGVIDLKDGTKKVVTGCTICGARFVVSYETEEIVEIRDEPGREPWSNET